MSGRRGRSGGKPKPDDQKKLDGTYRKDRARPVPKSLAGVPAPPALLDAEAKKTFTRIAKQLHGLGLMSPLYQATLAGFCCAYSDLLAARRLLKGKPRIVKTPSGYLQQHPAVGMSNQALEKMRQYSIEFGLSPSAMAGLIHASYGPGHGMTPGGGADDEPGDPETAAREADAANRLIDGKQDRFTGKAG